MYFVARKYLFPRNARFLVGRLLAAPATKFLELNFSLNLLLVFMRIIIPPLTNGAPQGYQIIGIFHFRHGENDSLFG